MDTNYIWQNIEKAIQVMSYWEVIAVFTGVIYVLLAAKENIWCWFFGIISSAIYIFLFIKAQLYAESFLYSYYVLAGFYGWYTWGNPKTNVDLKITIWSIKQQLLTVFIGFLLSLLLFILLKNFTTAALPLIDAHTTIFSFIATYMVIQKKLYNWIYWILIDMVSIGLYANRELHLSSVLMFIYALVAIVGFLEWKKAYRLQEQAITED